MFVGLAMAGAIVSAGGKLDPSTFGPRSTIALLAPLIVALAVVFIPVLDFLLAVIRRTKDGRHPFSADKQHLHHRMLAIGHTHRQAVLIFYLWAFVLAGGAVVAGLRQLAGRAGAPFLLLVAIALGILRVAAGAAGARRGAPARRTVGAAAAPDRRSSADVSRPAAGAEPAATCSGRRPRDRPSGRPVRPGRGGRGDRRTQPLGRHLVAATTCGSAGRRCSPAAWCWASSAALIAGAGAVPGVVIGTVIVGALLHVSRRWRSPRSARSPRRGDGRRAARPTSSRSCCSPWCC